MSLHPSVRQKWFWGNMIISAPVQNTCLIFLMKICPTIEHLFYNHFAHSYNGFSFPNFGRTQTCLYSLFLGYLELLINMVKYSEIFNQFKTRFTRTTEAQHFEITEN